PIRGLLAVIDRDRDPLGAELLLKLAQKRNCGVSFVLDREYHLKFRILLQTGTAQIRSQILLETANRFQNRHRPPGYKCSPRWRDGPHPKSNYAQEAQNCIDRSPDGRDQQEPFYPCPHHSVLLLSIHST